MNREERVKFAQDYMATITRTVVSLAESAPDGWDGKEIRCLLADVALDSLYALGKARREAYKNWLRITDATYRPRPHTLPGV